MHDSKITLRKTTIKDAKKSAEWLNNPEVTKFLGITAPVTYESRKKFLKERLEDPSEINFSIIENENKKYIGNIYIYNIDKVKKEGELGIFLGETNCWGKGYAKRAINLILEHAFDKLGLDKVYAKCIRANERACNCYLKMGFVKQGEYKKANEKTDILYFTRNE